MKFILNYVRVRSLPELSGLATANPFLLSEYLLPREEGGGRVRDVETPRLSSPTLAILRSDTVETAETLVRSVYHNTSLTTLNCLLQFQTGCEM